MPFDESKALRVKQFCESLTVTFGERAGMPFKLLPWQWNDVVRPLFGTVKDDGMRQYRFCFLFIPKKSGKTPISAALGLYGLFADREPSPEVYVAAAEREQAGYCFRYALHMVQSNPVLSRNCKIIESQKRIINKKNKGFMHVLSAEAYSKHGINPSMAIIDELHAHGKDELYYTLTSGTHYARKQQVVLVMTTAGVWDKQAIWSRLLDKARQIERGVIQQDNFLPVVYMCDPEEDDPHDENVWARVNPSLNHLFNIDKMREEFKETENDPIARQKFYQYRLNMPVKSAVRWMPAGVWEKGDKPFDKEALRGKRCFGGIDLSNKWDLTAFVLVFPPQDGIDDYIILPHFFCPEDSITKRSRTDAVHYEIWNQQGHITATPGNVIDEAFIKQVIIDADSTYHIEEIGFDPWNATALSVDLFNNCGFVKGDGKSRLVEMRQGFKTLSEPTKDLRAKAMQGRIVHGGHPVLSWNVDNMVVRQDANENVAPDKDKATERIDGAVATIMAWGRCIFAEPEMEEPTITILGGDDAQLRV